MHRLIVALALLTGALWTTPGFAQARKQLGPLCTTDTTPADQQIDACNKIIALKVFSGEQLAGVYFWRFSKKRKLPLGSRFSGGTCRPRGGATPPGVEAAI